MGSDPARCWRSTVRGYFNPRSPDGERPRIGRVRKLQEPISIHAPRMGSDRLREPHSQRRRCISIHAPRMGSDRLPQYWHGSVVIFQSTLPGWGATWFLIASKWQSLFQSTLPGWGATGRDAPYGSTRGHFNPRSPDGERLAGERGFGIALHISIHAPRMGSDFGRPSNTLTALFQSTLPGWGATDLVLRVGQFEPISIHAPRMGSDQIGQ